MSKYETTFFSYFENLKRSLRAAPLNLGGVVATASGGYGGPPGGFIGYLPQGRVAYDTLEAELSGFVFPNPYSASGYLISASLLDNLNHIRYRIAVVEGLAFGNTTVTVQENSITVLSGVSILNFEGGAGVAATGAGKVTITVSGNDSGASKVSVDDTTMDYLESKVVAGSNVTITVLNPGGNEQLSISATTSGIPGNDEKVKVSSNDTTANYLYNKITVTAPLTKSQINDGGDESLGISWTSDIFKSMVSSNDASWNFLENKITAGAGIGITVLNEGFDEELVISVSGYTGGGGTPLVIKEAGVVIASGIGFIDFEGGVTVSAYGNGALVTISGGAGSGLEAPFVGAKTYRTTNFQLSTSTGWQDVGWEASEYESDPAMWVSGAGIGIQEDGYYSIIGQVTLSGAIPTTERVQLGIFEGFNFKVGIYDGYYPGTTGNRSLQVLYQGNLTSGNNMNMKILNGQGSQPYVLSGVANSFLAVHKIHGAVQATVEDPKTVNPYLGSGTISVNDQTETAITWTAENYDTDTMWTSGTQIDINTAGYYHVDASCVWEDLNNHGGTPFQVKIGIRLNGTTMLAQKWEWHDVDTGGANTDALSTPLSCDTPHLTTSDYLEVVVWHSKGSTANNIIRSPGYNTYCMVHKVQ